MVGRAVVEVVCSPKAIGEYEKSEYEGGDVMLAVIPIDQAQAEAYRMHRHRHSTVQVLVLRYRVQWVGKVGRYSRYLGYSVQ